MVRRTPAAPSERGFREDRLQHNPKVKDDERSRDIVMGVGDQRPLRRCCNQPKGPLATGANHFAAAAAPA